MFKQAFLYISKLLLLAAVLNTVSLSRLYAQAAPNVSSYTIGGLADWDGDGHQDIVARDAANLLWLYPGDSSRGYSQYDRVQIGNGWKGYTFGGLADWDSDGHQDIVARDSAGLLWLYPGDSSRGYSQYDRVQIGNGW